MSKKLSTVILTCIAAFVALHSCKKPAKKIYTVDLHTSSKAIRVPATTYDTSAITYGPSVVAYNVDSFIQAQTGTSLTVNDIKSAHITAVTLTILDTTTADNLGSFENIASILYSDRITSTHTSGVDTLADVPGFRISLPVDSTEMKQYFGNIFSYSVMGKLRRHTTNDLHCKVEYTFKIDVEG